MKSLTIFLDASVILSGLASATGGSRKLLISGGRGKIKLLTTPLVIQEVADHLKKLVIQPDQLKSLLSSKIVRLITDPTEEMVKKFSQVSPDPDDAHVLAGAGLSGADILITLDKKHILIPEVRRILKPMQVKSPKEFWRWMKNK